MIDLRKKESEFKLIHNSSFNQIAGKYRYGKVTVYDSGYFPDGNKSRVITKIYAIHDDLPNVEFQIHWYQIYAVGNHISKIDVDRVSNEVYDAFYKFDKKCVTSNKILIDENKIEGENDMIDLREKKTSKHEEDEIKFVNKGEKFKSEKGDDIEIVDIDKGDDKTTVTYKLGSDEKKGDIEDVIKMLNGAEYKKTDDKKDEKKGCKSEDDEDGAEDGEDDGEQTDEKKAKKEADGEDDKDDSEDNKKNESADDGSVEITITEEFHVPGTDIVFEAGDVIKVIPRKED